jgi:hypothetical protein
LEGGKLIRAVLVGTKKLHNPINNRTLVLRNALVVLALKSSLISVTLLANDSISTVFEKDKCIFKRDNSVCMEGRGIGNLYFIAGNQLNKNDCGCYLSALQWHYNLGHPSLNKMRKMLHLGGMKILKLPQNLNYDSCMNGKAKKPLFRI